MTDNITFFKEYFDFMDDMTPEEFYEFMGLIRDLRFNDIDTKPEEVENKTIRLAWRCIRPSIIKSRRNARVYEKKKQTKTEQKEEEVSTYTPTEDITDDDLEKIFQAETKESSRDVEWRIRQVAAKTGKTQDWVQSQYNDYRQMKLRY